MEAQENYCQKEINHIKVLCRLNIVYIVIICLIISVCTLCIIPKCVSEYAFQNFSFASTIVSIVLAVVSIVYSLWSGQKSNNQYIGMSNIESKIDSQLKGFERIEASFANKLAPLNVQLEQIKEDQTKTRETIDKFTNLLGSGTVEHSTTESHKYIYKDAPVFAVITLYMFASVFKTKDKRVPVKSADELLGKYWSGFMVAFSRSLPQHLNYDSTKDGVKLITFDENYFGDASFIKGKLLNDYSNANGIIERVDGFFANSDNN